MSNMNNNIELGLQKVATLLFYSNGRTTAETQMRLDRAMGPAERNELGTSVFDDPDTTITNDVTPALDAEIKQAKEQFHLHSKALEAPEEPAQFGGLDTNVLAALSQLQAPPATPDIMDEAQLTPQGQQALQEIRNQVDLAERIINECRDTFTAHAQAALAQTPEDQKEGVLEKILETTHAPTSLATDLALTPKALLMEQNTRSQHSETVLENWNTPKTPTSLAQRLVTLAIDDYLPTPLPKGNDNVPGGALSQSGRTLTTMNASNSPEPTSGVASIRALDTYFALTFPESQVSRLEERIPVLLHHTLTHDVAFKSQLREQLANNQTAVMTR